MLETRRLRLRRFRASDQAALVALDSDALVMRYVGSPPGARAPDETADRVRQRIAADHGPYGWWIVEGREDGAFHGVGLLLPMPDGEDVEVGYRLARESWGRGIATEAASALVAYGFRDAGLSRLVAVAYPDNRASRRVLEKVGFVYEGVADYRGARIDRFSLSAGAWRAAGGRGGAPG